MKIEAGQVAVITGAGSGIGRALAEKAAQSGMRVVVADIEQPRLDDTVAALGQIGAEAIGVRTDVSVEEDVQRLADTAFAEFGHVNLLCNNAGVFSGGLMWERTMADWKWVMGVNVDGLIHAVRAFVPRMLEDDAPGHIVNTASMGGLVTGAKRLSVGDSRRGEDIGHDLFVGPRILPDVEPRHVEAKRADEIEPAANR